MNKRLRKMRKEWHRLNDAIFGGALPEPGFVVEKGNGQAHGLFIVWDDGLTEIVIYNRRFKRSNWRQTLAHEMVHQWQHHIGASLHHNLLFLSWSDRIKAELGKGLLEDTKNDLLA